MGELGDDGGPGPGRGVHQGLGEVEGRPLLGVPGQGLGKDAGEELGRLRQTAGDLLGGQGGRGAYVVGVVPGDPAPVGGDARQEGRRPADVVGPEPALAPPAPQQRLGVEHSIERHDFQPRCISGRFKRTSSRKQSEAFNQISNTANSNI